MAAALRQEPDLEVELASGRYGEFTVLADGEVILGSGALGFLGVLPSLAAIREAIRKRAGEGPRAR